MADPGFVQKMVLESAFAACASLWYEYRARGDKFKDELDLVMINTIGMAAATGATVWLVAPSRSYGSIQKFPWQQVRAYWVFLFLRAWGLVACIWFFARLHSANIHMWSAVHVCVAEQALHRCNPCAYMPLARKL